MKRITEQSMECPDCGWIGPLGQGIADVDGDGGIGCPVEECGGLLELA